MRDIEIREVLGCEVYGGLDVLNVKMMQTGSSDV